MTTKRIHLGHWILSIKIRRWSALLASQNPIRWRLCTCYAPVSTIRTWTQKTQRECLILVWHNAERDQRMIIATPWRLQNIPLCRCTNGRTFHYSRRVPCANAFATSYIVWGIYKSSPLRCVRDQFKELLERGPPVKRILGSSCARRCSLGDRWWVISFISRSKKAWLSRQINRVRYSTTPQQSI